MKIHDLRMVGIRCFEDTGDIHFDPKCNIFVGKNNAGKSSLLKAILGLQLHPFDNFDVRPGDQKSCYVTLRLDEIIYSDVTHVGRPVPAGSFRVAIVFRGEYPPYNDAPPLGVGISQPLFHSTRPLHQFVAFVAKRKAAEFNQDISLSRQSSLDGTFSSLYSRIDLLAAPGHSEHGHFHEAVKQIIGLPITTKASQGGKVAGFYFNDDTFVTLDRMGDGVSEMVALIVELCIERNKIFVLEEPETNLHPQGLKALLAMIRKASEQNQFFIATHSNVVVRELGGMEGGKVFRVFRDGESYTSPSKVEEVERTPAAHMELLRELGYEFTDFELYEAWLFLEESSAERVIRDILIPFFALELRGRLRTYAAGGATKLEPSVSEFQRLVVFIHLQPVYKDRLWIRADGDAAGEGAVMKIREAFAYLNEDALSTFGKAQFELYYPLFFQEKVNEVLAIEDKRNRSKQKAELLQEVLIWTETHKDQARAAWEISAQEPIKLLQSIRTKLMVA
jgi:predicted ATPase